MHQYAVSIYLLLYKTSSEYFAIFSQPPNNPLQLCHPPPNCHWHDATNRCLLLWRSLLEAKSITICSLSPLPYILRGVLSTTFHMYYLLLLEWKPPIKRTNKHKKQVQLFITRVLHFIVTWCCIEGYSLYFHFCE